MLMNKLKLLFILLFSLTFVAHAFPQTFTFQPGDIVTETVELESYKNIQVDMTHEGFSDLTFGWVTIENNILDKWEYSSCDNGGCYSLLPDSATVGPLSDTVPGYIRLTVNPRDQTGTSTVKLYVYNIKYPDEGKFVTFDITAVLPTSIDNPEVPALSIYPNPATDYLMLKNPSSTASQFELIDLAGKTLLEDIVNPLETKKIILNSYPKGIYFVRLQKASAYETRKIIIQ